MFCENFEPVAGFVHSRETGDENTDRFRANVVNAGIYMIEAELSDERVLMIGFLP